MCDYSLHAHPNRLAQADETLILAHFSFGSKGFASAEELASRATLGSEASMLTAVCVPPGARLRLSDMPIELQQELGVGHTEEVTFTQIGCDAWAYRDAVRFSNGKEILLQRLREQQRAHVLALSSEVRPAPAVPALVGSGIDVYE
jgi:hypothetical protein